jgi:hypothetical protein
MTTLPTWAIYAVSFGSPALAFLGVLAAQYVPRKGAKELEFRSKREEVMRNLRWASELAVSDDEGKAKLGVAQLAALAQSDMLDEQHQLFIDAALVAVIREPVEEVEQIAQTGDAQAVAVVTVSASGQVSPRPPVVESTPASLEGEEH